MSSLSNYKIIFIKSTLAFMISSIIKFLFGKDRLFFLFFFFFIFFFAKVV